MNIDFKKHFFEVNKCILLFGVALFIGLFLQLVVYSLPSEIIRTNVFSSYRLLENEGVSPKLWYFYATAQDNYTDAVMLLEAANTADLGIPKRALLNYYEQTITDGESDSPYVSYINLGGKKTDASRTESEQVCYGRYWHGYLVILKPLLLLTNYEGIRCINLFFQIVLTVIIAILFFRFKYRWLGIGYIGIILLLSPITNGICMQYSSCYYIFNLSILFLLLMKKKSKNFDVLAFFLLVGMSTSYFDFLTYPITTLGIPYIVYYVLYELKYDVKRQWINMIKACVSWGVGYAGMWISKWILVAALTDVDMIADAINSLQGRTVTSDSLVMCIIYNVGAFLINPVTIVALIFAIIFLVRNKSRISIKKSSVLIAVIILPFVWYAFAKGHSTNHFWFTFRNLIISLFGVFGILETVGLKQNQNKLVNTSNNISI